MAIWSEAWLRDYQARRDAGVPPSRSPWPVCFTLDRPIPLLNELLRMHWSARRKYQRALSAQIASLVPQAVGQSPLTKAAVTIVRYSIGVPDPDAVTPKSLLDCLLVRSKRHPDGLGLIIDDDPSHLTLDIKAARCAKKSEQRTEVTIANGC